MNRRQMIAGAIGGRFALAVRPVSAGTITTGTEGLDAGEVTIPSGAGTVAAYRAMPGKRGGKPFPVVLVVHEIFGVHEYVRDVCRRLAKQGYFAVAPDLFARQGDVSKLTDFKAIRGIVSQVPDAQVLGDFDATVAWAKGSGAADVARLGITGFCWGGRIVWLYAAHAPSLRAGVAWYGRLVGDKNPQHPQQPVDLAGTLKAPVLGLYGGQDEGIPLSSVDEMKKALASGSKAARASELQIYPQAGHAFHADYRPSYVKDAAEDGWTRMLAWFKTHGVA